MQEEIHYKDELNDEFAGDSLKPKKIDAGYRYMYNSPFMRLMHFILYWIVGFIPAKIFLSCRLHHRIVGGETLRDWHESGFFLYGNHTNNMADPLVPNFLLLGRRNFFVVNANNVSIPVIGLLTPIMGAIPLPKSVKASQNFMECLRQNLSEKNCITVYPEGHIWPFYTKIRPFKSNSFKFPVQFDVPSFCFTNTYQKYKDSSYPQMVTYVDGPFYPDKNLGEKEQREDLRNRIYEKMCERAKNSNFEYIKYVKDENDEKTQEVLNEN